MKNILLIQTISLGLSSIVVNAQNTSVKKIKRFNPTNIQLHIGSNTDGNTSSTVNDFYTLAPNSQILKNNLVGWNTYNNISLGNSSNFKLLLGFQLGNKQKSAYKKNRELRVGLSINSNEVLHNNLQKSTSTIIDTLVSTQTGQKYYIDSVYSENYNLSYNYNQIRIDLAMLYKWQAHKRWVFIAGYGANIGVGIGNYTYIRYTTSNNSGGNYYGYNANYSSKYETTKNKSNLGYCIYLPLGMDFKVGKRSEFWKHIHLTFELQPCISAYTIPELTSNYTNFSIGQYWGLKVIW